MNVRWSRGTRAPSAVGFDRRAETPIIDRNLFSVALHPEELDVGAAAALFIYVVMQSNVISLIDPSKVSFETGLVLGFVAGFSEQFVLSTVAKVSGAEKQESGTGGKPGLSQSTPGRGGEGGGSSINKSDSTPVGAAERGKDKK